MKRWLSAVGSLLESILSDLDTPLALSVWIQVKNEEWDQLAYKWVDPAHYPEGLFNALKYRKDVQAVDLLRKAPLPTTFDRSEAALAAWEDAETQCYITNEFIESIRSKAGPQSSYFEAHAAFLARVRKRMTRWLGPIPSFLEGGFGPGTCVEYKGGNPTVVDKVYLTPTTTPDASHLFRWHYDQTLWGRRRWECQLGAPGVSRGNRLTTVPKDGKTDRPISIEPLGNLWLQLGVGRYLKRRIVSIGLPSQKTTSREIFPGLETGGYSAQDVHRQLLRDMSKWSTIDLSSASDTVARELIREVLPPDWYELLDAVRSKLTQIPSGKKKVWRHLEKFSSMGNGFTFELETLVFSALLSVGLRLTPGVDLWVFGDDIILPKASFDNACNLLAVYGFTVNRRKSYHDGPFYESCGGNTHSGVDVTPVRIRGPIEEPPKLYAFHNALACRGFSRKTLRLVRNRIPRQLQFPGPEHLGDSVLHRLPYRSQTIGSIAWLRTLKTAPVDEIPLERWSPELAMVALLLGSTTRIARRGVRTRCFGAPTSVS